LDRTLDWLLRIDTQLFLFLNSLHTPWLDPVFFWISDKYSWFWLYAIMIVAIIYMYRKRAIIYLGGMALTILFTDQLTSSVMKPYFGRLRPTHTPELQELVHTVNGYLGGNFGFASGHAANSFAVATFIYLLFKSKYPAVSLLYVWAAIIAYSRIYLGVHFPLDILVGALVGTFIAAVLYYASRYTDRHFFGEAPLAH